MTRPGYVRRPILPCADGVTLLSASPEALRSVRAATVEAPVARRSVRESSDRLRLYPWWLGADGGVA